MSLCGLIGARIASLPDLRNGFDRIVGLGLVLFFMKNMLSVNREDLLIGGFKVVLFAAQTLLDLNGHATIRTKVCLEPTLVEMHRSIFISQMERLSGKVVIPIINLNVGW